jgi:hypothetical protein
MDVKGGLLFLSEDILKQSEKEWDKLQLKVSGAMNRYRLSKKNNCPNDMRKQRKSVYGR